jgi:hypothetical protein
MTVEALAPASKNAFEKYCSGYYSSGYDAGLNHCELLGGGTHEDAEVRAFGDFLIALGSTI